MSEIISLDPSGYAMVFLALLAAYIIFGMAGFGTALVASPLLSIYLPIGKIVPLLALMDMCAAFISVRRDGKNSNTEELKRLVPFMIIGSLVGALVLLNTQPDTLLLIMGIFVICYSLYSLCGFKPDALFSTRAALPFGSLGGVFSALFGSGGFMYSIYLNGRIRDIESIRITQTTLIGLSTLTRVVLFSFAGVYWDARLIVLAFILTPGMLTGITLGRRFTQNMSRHQFIRLINIIILASGAMLIFRYITTGH